jgi:hypothetical protein
MGDVYIDWSLMRRARHNFAVFDDAKQHSY